MKVASRNINLNSPHSIADIDGGEEDLSGADTFVNHRLYGYYERFLFTGKERDPETGFTYHGARYYDAALMCSWFAVDPMSDKYPSISPYNYCAWNPVRLVDENGEDCEIVIDSHKKTVTIRANFYYNKNQLGPEADIFLDGFKSALGSWQDDIREALGDKSLGVEGYSIDFQFDFIECNDPKKSAYEDGIGNSLRNDSDISSMGVVTNNHHFRANIGLHSRGNNPAARDVLFYGDDEYQGTLKHEIGHFFGLYDRYPEATDPAPFIEHDLMTLDPHRNNAVEPFKRIWHSLGLNGSDASVIINATNRENK